LTALLIVALAPPPSPSPSAPRRTWKVQRAGVTFEMTPSDLRAWTGDPAGPPVLSMAALLAAQKKQFDDYARELADALAGPEPPTYGEPAMDQAMAFDVLSIVGALVTYRESSAGYTPGTAHPTRYDVLHVVDLQRKGARPTLLDFYSETQLVRALQADRWIRKFAHPEGGFAKAATLEELVAALDLEWAQENAEEGDCAFDVSFDTDMVERFFFDHVSRDRVAVRIAVPPGSEWCNRAAGGQQIGLLLPIPDRLREDLLAADRLQSGFLAGNRKAAGTTSFSAHWEVDVRTLVPKR
jgi:hypothetical protein